MSADQINGCLNFEKKWKKMWRFPQGQRQHSEVSVLRAFITCGGSLLIEEKTNWMPKQNDEFMQQCDKCKSCGSILSLV